jgi:predicted Zn finger-like uncharacterized protein
VDVICPACNAVYRIADHKIPKNRTATAACKKCGRKLTIRSASERPASERPVSGTSPRAPRAVSPHLRPGPDADRPTVDATAGTAFPARHALRFGWRALKRDPVLVIVGMFIVPVCIQMVFEVFNGLIPEEMWPISGVLAAVAFVLELAVTLGIAGICLKICDGRKTGFNDLHAHIPQILTYLISSILFGLLCVGGFLFFIVPGILLSLWLQFYGFAIVDEKAGPVVALKKSHAIARGRLWRIFVFSSLLVFYNFLGLLLCGMGLLITVPVSFIAWAYLYRSLQGRTLQPIP